MEITGQLDEATKLAIIPTVVLPFTIIGMILTSVATWIAALFGFELKAEGPKRLFEVLIKPKVLAFALVSNLIVYGAIKGVQHLANGPYPLWWVELQNASPQPSDRNYETTNLPTLTTTVSAQPASNDLEVVWELPLKSVVFGLSLVAGDSLFAGLEKGRLIEVDLKSGQLLRKFEIGQPVMASPVIANNKIYVGEGIHLTYNARIYSFDLKSGEFTGAFQTAGHIERAAVLATTADQSLLIFPAGKDGLYAINPETMQKVWQAPFGHFDTFPAVDGEQAYIGSGLEAGFEEAPTKAFAINLQTGNVVWEKPLPTSVWGIPVLWNNVVCLPTGDVYKNLKFGQLSCYEKASGKDYFIFNTTGSLISQPVVRGDHLVVSDIYGKIYQFNLKTRQLEWTIQVPTKGFSYASVTIDSQNRILLPGEEGLYVYSRENQALLSVWKPEGHWPGTFNNVVAYKDLMILADQAGVLRALRFKN